MFVVLSGINSWWIALAAGLTAAWFYWRWPIWGLGLVLFSAPLYLIKLSAGWLPMTLLEVVLVSVCLSWFFKKISERQKTDWRLAVWQQSEIFWPLVLLLGGAILATAISFDKMASLGILKSWLIEPMIFAGLIHQELKNQRHLKILMGALIAGALGVALISLEYLFAGRLTYDSRLAAIFLSPNHLAMAMAPGLILCLGWLTTAKSKISFLVLGPAAALIGLVFYFTFSYATWLAVWLALVFLLVVLWRKKIFSRRWAVWAAAILAAAILAAVILQLPGAKIADLLKFDRSSWRSRLMVWQAAGAILKDHWVLGIGPGMFQQFYLDYQKYFPPYLEWAVPQPHNLFLAWWLQAGLAGIIGFLWLLKKFFSRIKENLKPSFWGKEGVLTVILAAVMVYFIIHGFVDTPYWKNDLALVFWAITVLGYKAGRLGD